MKLIGLSGPAGVGKDTVADYLVANHGYLKFSFSDALYEEVAEAFGIAKSVLYNRDTKETELQCLQYYFCKDTVFQDIIFGELIREGVKYPMDKWLSPRWVLQRWGTAYRRAQDPEYWIKKSDAFVQTFLANYVELYESTGKEIGGLVNSSVRFPNEREFINRYNGEVWHIQRPGWASKMGGTTKEYVAEAGLEVLPPDKVIVNSGTIEELGTASTIMLCAGQGAHIAPGNAMPEYVSCDDCGTVHETCTEAYAKQEIKAITSRWTAGVVKHADLTVDDYRRCLRCNGTKFTPFVFEGKPDASFFPEVIWPLVE